MMISPERERLAAVFGVITLGIALFLLWVRTDQNVRDSVVWALRSWITPPDAPAQWEQGAR